MSEQAELKRFTRKGLAERNTKTDAVFVIENIVYDVTKFLDDHPGGHEVLLNVAGKDASEDFDDVGHSTDAKEMMKKYIIGELVEEDKVQPKRKQFSTWSETESQANKNDGSFLTSWKFPVVLGLVMTVLYSYLFG
ncbi:cytochrome b5-like [Maniola jurtina]|uniref:cytochrome b5-like n=1 Tax=Maniola jurtina TaxID=191418 RepID=UPI001E68C105|nr:cytochrome b5-like [Maniola jurtina]